MWCSGHYEVIKQMTGKSALALVLVAGVGFAPSSPQRGEPFRPPAVPNLPPTGTGQLRLRLWAEKSIYRSGEALQLGVQVTNVGQEVIVLDGRLEPFADLDFHVVDSSGRTVRYPGWNLHLVQGPPVASDLIRLPPTFCWGRSIVGTPRQIQVREPGRYRLWATFSTISRGVASGVQIWRGDLISNRIPVEVLGSTREIRNATRR